MVPLILPRLGPSLPVRSPLLTPRQRGWRSIFDPPSLHFNEQFQPFQPVQFGEDNLGFPLGYRVEDVFQLYATDAVSQAVSSNIYTATARSVGPERVDRWVIVGLTLQEDVTVDSVTIGGVSATQVKAAVDTGSTPDMIAQLWWAPYPTGTTATIVVTCSGGTAVNPAGITVFRVVGHLKSLRDTALASGSAATLSVSNCVIPAGGGAVYVFCNNTDTTAVAWTNAQEVTDGDVGNHRGSCAVRLGEGNPTVTADGATANQAMVAISFSRAGLANGGNDSFTKLLLHGIGADNSAGIIDSSASAHTVTIGSSAFIDTAQSKFFDSSIRFDGADDFITLPGGTDFTFGTGDFTIDFWFRVTTVAGITPVFFDWRGAGLTGAYPCAFVQSNVLVYHANSANRITGSTTVTTNTWHHFELGRSGTSTKMFLNGVQEGSTYSDSTNYTVGTSRPMFGASGTDSGTAFEYTGWMQEIRVSKGVCRHTSNFTPPTRMYS